MKFINCAEALPGRVTSRIQVSEDAYIRNVNTKGRVEPGYFRSYAGIDEKWALSNFEWLDETPVQSNNTILKWEPLQNDNPTLFINRAKVFGGWLVSATMDVRSAVNNGYNQPDYTTGYEWRTSITFVPDQNHEWNIKDNL